MSAPRIKYLALIGQNVQFVAFIAHCFATAWLLEHIKYKWEAAIAIILFAAWKEFWYDAKYETNPPQTFKDNLEDFLGYAVGVVLWILFAR